MKFTMRIVPANSAFVSDASAPALLRRAFYSASQRGRWTAE
jgi:hypothetical protein